jgi:hypothetical protein
VNLKKPELFRQHAYIDGEWIGADSAATITVGNPSTGAVIGHVPRMGGAETRRAIEAADRALPAWRALSAKERAITLRRWYELIIENQDDLARIMTLEQGKPLAEARGEIVFAASYIEWYAEEGKRIYGDVIPGSADKRLLVLKQPVGVCAAITPWNFPSAMITRKAGPALAAGCTMVIKPASQTPFRLRPTCLVISCWAPRTAVVVRRRRMLILVISYSDWLHCPGMDTCQVTSSPSSQRPRCSRQSSRQETCSFRARTQWIGLGTLEFLATTVMMCLSRTR